MPGNKFLCATPNLCISVLKKTSFEFGTSLCKRFFSTQRYGVTEEHREAIAVLSTLLYF
jgi:hypothetical protein